eukprot:5628752-Pyramimonas_sp.AAC.1
MGKAKFQPGTEPACNYGPGPGTTQGSRGGAKSTTSERGPRGGQGFETSRSVTQRLFFCLSVCLSVRPSVCLSVSPSVQ